MEATAFTGLIQVALWPPAGAGENGQDDATVLEDLVGGRKAGAHVRGSTGAAFSGGGGTRDLGMNTGPVPRSRLTRSSSSGALKKRESLASEAVQVPAPGPVVRTDSSTPGRR
jgi:hypothetical protein